MGILPMIPRAQLKEPALTLDVAGFSEAYLRTAWRDARSEDIAADICGFDVANRVFDGKIEALLGNL